MKPLPVKMERGGGLRVPGRFKSGFAVSYSLNNFGSVCSDTRVYLALSPCVVLWIRHPLSTLKLRTFCLNGMLYGVMGGYRWFRCCSVFVGWLMMALAFPSEGLSRYCGLFRWFGGWFVFVGLLMMVLDLLVYLTLISCWQVVNSPSPLHFEITYLLYIRCAIWGVGGFWGDLVAGLFLWVCW